MLLESVLPTARPRLLAVVFLWVTILTVAVVPGYAQQDDRVVIAAGSDDWHTLLYYGDTFTGLDSHHTDASFFLSPDGRHDPVAELKAHLDAWVTDQQTGDDHPACRFPARYHWLSSQGLLDGPSAVTPRCAKFESFRNMLAATGVTMVFPVPHMGDVSTLFAHSFLRLDRDPPAQDHRDDFTLNFAAWMRKGVSQAEIVRNGLTNGFDGIFTVIPYERKLAEYSGMDARDIWEYRLDLTREETDQLVRHVWEVKSLRSEYRFFSFNCSNQKLHFIDVARPGLNLHRTQQGYVIPKDAVNAVVDAGIVSGVRFVPSDRTFRRLERTNAEAPSFPLQGQESGRVSLMGGMREALGFVEAGIRAASQDRRDPPSAWPVGAELSVLDLRVRRYDQGPTELLHLDLFSARSADPRDAGASPWSWRFGTGFTGRRLIDEAAMTLPGLAGSASEQDRYRSALEDSDWINPFYVRTAVGPAWGSASGVFFTLVGGEWQADGDLDRGQQAYALLQQGVTMRGDDWQATLEWQLMQPTWAGGLPADGSVEAVLARRLGGATSLALQLRRERDVLGYQSGGGILLSRYF